MLDWLNSRREPPDRDNQTKTAQSYRVEST